MICKAYWRSFLQYVPVCKHNVHSSSLRWIHMWLQHKWQLKMETTMRLRTKQQNARMNSDFLFLTPFLPRIMIQETHCFLWFLCFYLGSCLQNSLHHRNICPDCYRSPVHCTLHPYRDRKLQQEGQHKWNKVQMPQRSAESSRNWMHSPIVKHGGDRGTLGKGTWGRVWVGGTVDVPPCGEHIERRVGKSSRPSVSPNRFTTIPWTERFSMTYLQHRCHLAFCIRYHSLQCKRKESIRHCGEYRILHHTQVTCLISNPILWYCARILNRIAYFHSPFHCILSDIDSRGSCDKYHGRCTFSLCTPRLCKGRQSATDQKKQAEKK